MKKIVALVWVIIAVPAIVSAETNLSSVKLPVAGSGVTIVPAAQMNMPKATSWQEDVALFQEKSKGYINSESSYPKFLLNMSGVDFVVSSSVDDPEDTHIKHAASEIKLAFPYVSDKAIIGAQILGYAPGGLYIKNKGWSEIATFFKVRDIGTCKYNLANMKVANGAVQISAEKVRYDINNKPTDIFVAGSVNSGFIYSVSWFDDIYIHRLECANMSYDKNLLSHVIDIAKTIDVNKQ